MKSLFLSLGIVLSLTSVHAQQLDTRGGQGTFVVTSAVVTDLDQNQYQCEFKVAVNHFVPDVACGADLSHMMGLTSVKRKDLVELTNSCIADIQAATFVAQVVDGSCSVKVGLEILSTTDQFFSHTDSRSPGLFTWIQLNAGYSSLLMFPNYGK